MTTSLDRKLARCAREIAAAKAKAEAPTNGLTPPIEEEPYPEDVAFDTTSGKFQAQCCVCEKWCDIEGSCRKSSPTQNGQCSVVGIAAALRGAAHDQALSHPPRSSTTPHRPLPSLSRASFRAYIFRQKSPTRNVGITHAALYEAAAKRLGFPTYSVMAWALGWPAVGKAAAQLRYTATKESS